MADLNKSVSDTSHISEDVGQNLVVNGDFENAPAFVAATATNARWIDGSAAGSSATTSIYAWGITNGSGTFAVQFDSSIFNAGAYSIKGSITATNSFLDISNAINSAVLNLIPIYPSTAYKLTFYMKTNYTSGDSNDGAFILLTEKNSAGTAGATNNSTKIKTTTNFTQYTISFTSASTAAFLMITCRVRGNTGTATLIMDAWFDDIQLQSVASNGKVDLLVQPIVTPGVQNISAPKIWS